MQAERRNICALLQPDGTAALIGSRNFGLATWQV